MLYSEFIEGTGCKDNEHNYKVYKDLEIMYMNSDMSKAEIYEYGKKLVDNSKSPEQIALENKINAEIDEYKEVIEFHKKEVEVYKNCLENETEKDWIKTWKSSLKYHRDEIKRLRSKINELKWVLA